MKKFILLTFLSIFLMQCKQEKQVVIEAFSLTDAQIELKTILNLPEKTMNYHRLLPSWITVLGMPNLPPNNEKATIGRVLFYDKNLSANRLISCASCHKQSLGFGDNTAFSAGVSGKTERNSPPLSNVSSVSGHYSMINGKKPNFFWDQRAETVERQSQETLENIIEMGISADIAVSRVLEKKYYQALWLKVYGHFEPTNAEVLACLAEFVNAMGAENSRFDQGMSDKTANLLSETATATTIVTLADTIIPPAYYNPTNDTIFVPTTSTVVIETKAFPNLTLEESFGKDIFIKNCSKCHSPVRNFQEIFEACNGLDAVYVDAGKGKLTLNPADKGVFKSPSLKNIAKTAPYMHDGRFKTLFEVVEFYASGVKNHPNLHPLMKNVNGTPKNLNLSATEKLQLFLFLQTLTDEKSLTDVRFSNPFN
jgi:cytochrome c peroxidase